jgi:hypothetical protein
MDVDDDPFLGDIQVPLMQAIGRIEDLIRTVGTTSTPPSLTPLLDKPSRQDKTRSDKDEAGQDEAGQDEAGQDEQGTATGQATGQWSYPIV